MTPLRKIAARCGEPDLPERIYNAFLNKQAFLFVRDHDGFVLRPQVIEDELRVLIWAAWGASGAHERHIEEVKYLARIIGAKSLVFHSVRKGWLRVAPKQGWVRQADDEDGFLVFKMKL